MPILSDMIKAEIVTMLAQFCSTSEIIEALEVEHGVKVDRFQIRTYDATKSAFAAGEQLRSLFHAVRSDYQTRIEAVPIAHKAYRLNQLQKNYEAAVRRHNLVLANAILEQAAKEVGGALTNTQNLNVKSQIAELSADERRTAVAELIRKALETSH